MALETGTFVNDLVITNPPGTDPILQGDDHIRLIKNALKATFPNADKAFYLPDAITKTAAYTVVKADINKFFQGDATTAAFSFTLPTLTAADDGWYTFFVKSDASANAVTLVGTINGAANLVLSARYDAALIWWSGSAWFSFEPSPAVPDASETVKGIVELATTAEAEAGTDTARAITAAGLLAAVTGQETIWVPAPAMIARTTNGAASGTGETATNRVMRKSFDFDATTQEFVQFSIQMPKDWDEGTLIAQAVWSHAATTTNFGVVFALQAVAFANDDALDTAFGTEQTMTDTGGTTDGVYISPESAAITVAGAPAAEEFVVFQAKRVPADAADTMAIDARLHGLKIHYTTNAMTDD